MAAAVAAIVSRWEIRENLKSGMLLAAIARCVGCAIPTLPQKSTEWLNGVIDRPHAATLNPQPPPSATPNRVPLALHPEVPSETEQATAAKG